MVITNSVDYVRWTQTTALYLDKVDSARSAALYEILGVLDEVGEVAGMLKRQIRDSVPFDREKFGLELGDIAWYLARIHYNHADLPLNTENDSYPLIKELNWLEDIKGLTCFDIAIKVSEHLKPYCISKDAASRFIFGGRPKNVMEYFNQVHQGMSNESALNNFVTSMYRRVSEDVDTAGILMHIASEAHSMEAVFDWCTLCYKYNFNILDVLQENIIKLESRKDRGTLHGKGSER